MRTLFFYKITVIAVAAFWYSGSLFAQQGYIKGKIKNATEALTAATISIGNTTILSDQNGEFSLSLKPGTYTMIITHAGYKKIDSTITIEPGVIKNIVFNMIAADELEAVTIGSRARTQRTNLNTPIPVDVFSSNGLVETGQISLTQMLNFLAPSFNTSREVLNETMTLRGLDPQHVLILVNNIRYHPMAWIFSGNLRGQLGRGSVGNDLNSIPFPAIEKIEILRDGAAAQYGSDAIGGVINIVLRRSTGKTFIQTNSGQFYKKDGEKFLVGIYHGASLNKKRLLAGRQGFLGLSASYRNQQPTYRGGTYEGPVYVNDKALDDLLVQSRGFDRKAAVDNTGNTKLNSIGFAVNGGYPINDHTQIFWTILLNSRKLDRGGLFIFPRDSSRVNFFLYPDGFQSRNKSNTVDVSTIGGIKGKTKKGWYWDASSSYGLNSVSSHVTNTNNASQTFILGVNAPTSFYTGTDIFRQVTNDINFTKHFKVSNIGWGVEWRLENYHSKIGEEASWKNYDPVNYSQGGVGAQGPENATNKTRNVLGGYAEFETELTNHLLFNAATRYEYYNDFGSNIAGKLAARYKLSKSFMLRASVNNGFRAPALQQRYRKSIAESPNGPGRSIVVTGTFPNDHSVIKALGIPSLTAERSVNISGGFVSSFLDRINLVVDAYWIQIKNRIVLSGNFDRRPNNTIDKILDLNPDFDRIMRVSFFANSINTITKGVDIILDGNWKTRSSTLRISVSANFNSTKLFGTIRTSEALAADPQSSNTLFNSEERAKIEDGQPASKIILLTMYKTGKAKLIIRNTRFGKTSIAPLSGYPEFFSPKILTDINLTYSAAKWIGITLGANNISNIYPDRLKHSENTSQGSWIYSPEASPFGFNGGYYYVNLTFNF